jgi:4'-phosphopantetheinyl transferase
LTNAIVYYRSLTGLSRERLAARWLGELPLAKRMGVARASPASTIATLAGIDLLAHALKATGAEPRAIATLVYSEKGKPLLPGGPPFSISHTKTLAVCVVAPGCRVGIDVELAARVRLETLRRVATAEEIALVGSLPEGPAKLWTRKEAVLKAAGATVFEAANVVVRATDAEFSGERWFFRGPDSLDDHALALAFERSDVEVDLRLATDLA